MSKKYKSGVYKITCLENGMIYIGSSKNISNRMSDHRYKLKKNTHHNYYLQDDYNTYGLDKFKFEILEKCDEDDCLSLEQEYLDKLKPFQKLDNGYNINEVAGGRQTSGFKFFVGNGNCHVKQIGYPVPMPITYEEYYSKTREELCEECEGFTTMDYLEEDILRCNPEWND